MEATRERILCADSESLRHAALLGLDDEDLESQDWLKIFSNAEEARSYVKSLMQSPEVWVCGSDQMEGINLAAALKQDRPDAEIDLLCFQSSGSLQSRARLAGVSEVMDRSAFLNRYKIAKSSSMLLKTVIPESVPPAQQNPNVSASVSFARPAFPSNTAETKQDLSAPAAAASGTKPYPAAAAPRAENERGAQADGWNALPQAAAATPAPTPAAQAAGGKQGGAGFVLSVVGAGGGVGKSSVAALCACISQQAGHKTVLLDADLQFGDAAYLFACEKPLHIDELIEAPLRLESLSTQDRMPALLAAPLLLERSELAAKHMGSVIDMLRQRFDVVVVNTGANWSDLHVSLLEKSNNSLFVLDQRPSSLRCCQHALGLCSRCGVASQPFLFAINRCARKSLFSAVDISAALQGARVYELAEGGSAVEELLGCGQPLQLLDSKNAFARSVNDMLLEILPKAKQEQQQFLALPKEKKRRFFKRRG